MKKLKVILVDDEPDSTALLELYLKKYCPEVEIIGIFNSSTQALAQIPILKPDLLLLDIEMPVMNGFELLSALDSIPFKVVFVTAYNQFAVQAFKFNAMDYIVKPINSQELMEAIHRVEDQIISGLPQLPLIAEQFRKGLITKIAISASDGITFIDFSEIMYVESSSNYSYIQLDMGKKVVLSKTLKDVQDVLESHHFMRVHRQYIVNLNKIQHFDRKDGLLTMISGDKIPVSRSHREELIALFGLI
ncbi:MAG: LytTR family DNA-binding domain-containing protein [Flavobacteriaceae bacterium]|nr:LytTR family DNA-binding domain-containing protein [Flavobacteriaceae bacterium]